MRSIQHQSFASKWETKNRGSGLLVSTYMKLLDQVYAFRLSWIFFRNIHRFESAQLIDDNVGLLTSLISTIN